MFDPTRYPERRCQEPGFVCVGDEVIIPADLRANVRWLVLGMYSTRSVSEIVSDGQGGERLGIPGTPAQDMRTFRVIGHWPLEAAIAAFRKTMPMTDEMRGIFEGYSRQDIKKSRCVCMQIRSACTYILRLGLISRV